MFYFRKLAQICRTRCWAGRVGKFDANCEEMDQRNLGHTLMEFTSQLLVMYFYQRPSPIILHFIFSVCAEHVLSHPCIVVRRQCQVIFQEAQEMLHKVRTPVSNV